jgi:hypothetical protein
MRTSRTPNHEPSQVVRTRGRSVSRCYSPASPCNSASPVTSAGRRSALRRCALEKTVEKVVATSDRPYLDVGHVAVQSRRSCRPPRIALTSPNITPATYFGMYPAGGVHCPKDCAAAWTRKPEIRLLMRVDPGGIRTQIKSGTTPPLSFQLSEAGSASAGIAMSPTRSRPDAVLRCCAVTVTAASHPIGCPSWR